MTTAKEKCQKFYFTGEHDKGEYGKGYYGSLASHKYLPLKPIKHYISL